MNGYTADADRLAAQAADFPELAGRVGSIHRELSAALGEAGQCWGSDQVGQSFAAAHTGPAEATLGDLGSLPDRLGSVGTRFADTATAYREQDESGAATINSAGA